ncbi:MAG: hypothetical protein PVI71_10085 [Desulfobacterales bacterium]
MAAAVGIGPPGLSGVYLSGSAAVCGFWGYIVADRMRPLPHEGGNSA